MRPRTSWIIAACCLALLCGAMAWTTKSMLTMERDQGRMANEAAVQEMARLALWRMELTARDLVIDESLRTPEQYRPFAEPEALVNNKTNTAVVQSDLLTPSPLLGGPPDYVLLHFEMDATGDIRSPQVPRGQDLMRCQIIGVPSVSMFEACGSQLKTLSGILDKGPGAERMKALRATLRVPSQLSGNRAWLWSENYKASMENAVQSSVQTLQQQAAPSKNKKQDSLPSPVNSYAQQSINLKPEQVRAQQSEFNAGEEKARSEFLKMGTDRAGKTRTANALNNDEISKKAASKPGGDANPPAPKKPALLPAPSSAAPSTAPPSAAVASGSSTSIEMSEFRPFWMGDALILTRRVTSGSREWVQGAWLDWEKLRGKFLESVQDLFPNATVVPAPEVRPAGAHLVASLPVQLIPGTVAFAPLAFWSPLKISLGIAWICVLVAVFAVAMVLRGMMALSERRASFVSSVTHELRTPLATFKLYSEMLADGMVKEEAKKQQYLETLTGEADRLGHLVENVLSYSRIERGKGPAAACAVPVSDLLHRIEPRLNQRAMMAGMDFSVDAPPEITAIALRTDAGALEQILCNLVDNACKYGRRDGTSGRVELVVTKESRRICFAVRDYGPGIAPGEEKKLFLPFHKSAREAAHSKPGVGLGLALCRKLAEELRGTLEIDRSWRQGASFILKLPA